MGASQDAQLHRHTQCKTGCIELAGRKVRGSELTHLRRLGRLTGWQQSRWAGLCPKPKMTILRTQGCGSKPRCSTSELAKADAPEAAGKADWVAAMTLGRASKAAQRTCSWKYPAAQAHMDLQGNPTTSSAPSRTLLPLCLHKPVPVHVGTWPVMVAGMVCLLACHGVAACLQFMRGLRQDILPRLKADCRKVHGRTGWLRRSC